METPETTVVIETPKESRLKFKLDKAAGLYKVDRILPKGQRFPLTSVSYRELRLPTATPSTFC